MSHCSKTPLRFGLIAAGLWLSTAAAAFAQEAPPDITLRISASDIEVLSKALDALPITETAGTIIRIQAQIDAAPGPQWDKYRSATTTQEWCPGIGFAVTCPTPVKP
jgi:hypothetical protein